MAPHVLKTPGNPPINNFISEPFADMKQIYPLANLEKSPPYHNVDNGNPRLKGKSDQLVPMLQAFSEKHMVRCAEHLGISSTDISYVMPTTATQSGMLASFLRSSGGEHDQQRRYIHHVVQKLHPSTNVSQLELSWRSVLKRHDSYRTTFVPVDDEMAPFAQCVLSDSCLLSEPELKHWWCESDDLYPQMKLQILRDVEKNITLNKPPLCFTVLESAESSSIILSSFHGLFDGASPNMLFEDVMNDYRGSAPSLRLPLVTAVEAHFDANHEETLNYWKKMLEDYEPTPFPGVTGLSSTTPGKVSDTTTLKMSIAYSKLQQESQLSKISPLTIIQAAWSLILGAYSDSSFDNVFGTIISSQDLEKGPNSVFTTIPVRVCVTRNATNIEVLKNMSATHSRSWAHSQLPLNSLLTAEGRPYYDTLLDFQECPMEQKHGGETLWDNTDYPAMANDFAVMVEARPTTNDILQLRATFNKSHLNDEAARVMLRQLNDAIVWIVGNPNGLYLDGRSTMQMDLLSLSPGYLALDDNILAPKDLLIHAQFEHHSSINPNQTALIFRGSLDRSTPELNIEWTYSELNSRADKLARFLVKNFEPLGNAIIPFSLERSPELYVVILGIVKAGGCWCPIDPGFPSQRRHDLIVRTNSRMLLVSGPTSNQPPGAIPDGVQLIDVNKLGDSLQDDMSTPRIFPTDLAYLIWTSGTTGAPKGVQIQHKSASISMRSLQKSIPGTTSGIPVRCLQFAQPSFDVFVQDLFYTWGLGGTLISATSTIMLSSFTSLANLTSATHAHLTPAFGSIVRRGDCHTLEVITMIGEALNEVVKADWGHNMLAYNTYGPAEVTVVSTFRQFGGIEDPVKACNIGLPLPSVAAFVIADNKPIMVNGVGELALAGPQLSLGYLQDSKRTQERFYFNDTLNMDIYMTGDIVRQLYDGTVEFVGRKDDLVKLMGIRVELSEIGFLLRACHPQVDQLETMHISRHDRPAKLLVLFVAASSLDSSSKLAAVTDERGAKIAIIIAAAARNLLPEYMIPSVIIVLNFIPTTTSAKIDRKSLLAIYDEIDLQSWEQRLSTIDDLSPWTEDEAKVVSVLREFSNVELNVIQRATRLAALGVDSISAIRLTTKLNAANCLCSTISILQCRTVNELCSAVLSAGEKSLSSTKDSSIDVESKIEAFNKTWHSHVVASMDTKTSSFSVAPTTPLQEGLLGESMRKYQSYWSHHSFELEETVDMDRMRSAWQFVAEHNDALRIGFLLRHVGDVIGTDDLSSLNGSAFFELVYTDANIAWDVLQSDGTDLQLRVRDRADQIALKSHSCNYLDPPWAITILENGNKRTMMLSLHHAIHDGPSLDYILEDVVAAYRKKEQKVRTQIRQASISIEASQSSTDECSEFWKAQLSPFSSTGAITMESNGTEEGYHTEEIFLSPSRSEFQAATEALAVPSIASIIRTAWGCILAEILEPDDGRVVFGEVLSDRILDYRTSDCIGPLISVVPVPFYSNGLTTYELLAAQTSMAAAVAKNRQISPTAARKFLCRQNTEVLYPAVFTFHPNSQQFDNANQEGVWAETEDLVGLSVEHQLACNIFQEPDGRFLLSVSAEAAVMTKQRLNLVLRQIDALLVAMIKAPNCQITDLVEQFPRDLISVSTPRILEPRSDGILSNPTYWLEKYAYENPDWPAVEVASQIDVSSTTIMSWSYKTLNEEANRIREFISRRSIQGRMIGVCVGRTLQAYATILGVFKSGNTYLPIEEELPEERKSLLLRDSNAAILFVSNSSVNLADGVLGPCEIVDISSDDFLAETQKLSQSDKQLIGSQDDTSYLLYTSGSTGVPKGVLLSRRNLCAFVEAQSAFICDAVPSTITLAGRGKYLGLASRAFDVHIAEMFLAWRHGLCATTASRAMLLDDLGLALKQLHITHASFVPSLIDQAGLDPAELPELRFLGVGGEKISRRTLDTWAGHQTVTLVNAYGPTEVTIGCSSCVVDSNSNMRNIGRALGDTVFHVLLPGTLTYAKRCMPGELCTTGSLVGKGYLNRPDAKGFVENFHGERLYRTGDMVRLMPNDTVEIFGRSDDQTKIRGQRLELGEVTEIVRALSSEPIDVASLILQHPDLKVMQLVSFVANSKTKTENRTLEFIKEDFSETQAFFQGGCRKTMPAYMVPDLILPVSFIPLAATSGKADAKLLKDLFGAISLMRLLSGNDDADESAKPLTRGLTATETKIVDFLKKIIKTDLEDSRIVPAMNMFELGLDSLTAITLSVSLRKLGYYCSVAGVLSTATVEELGLLIDSNSRSVERSANLIRGKEVLANTNRLFSESDSGRAMKESVVTARPCLPLQEAVVARSLNDQNGTAYVNHIILELNQKVDMPRLQDAWRTSAQDNENLRTCFCVNSDSILQVILKPESTELSFLVENHPEISLEECLSQLRHGQDDIAREINRNIDEKPPLRLKLVHSKAGSLLLVSIHHSIYDAEVLKMLFDDVHQRYTSLTLVERPSSGVLLEYIASLDPAQAQRYWTKRFQGHVQSFPVIEPMIEGEAEPALVERVFTRPLSVLEALASKLMVTLPAVMQAVFAIALSKAHGINDIVFGLVLSGRSVPIIKIEHLLSPCITTIPQRVKFDDSTTKLTDIITKIQSESGQILEFQHTSLRDIHRWLDADKPLFNVLFSYIRSNNELATEPLWKELESHMPTDYSFALECEARASTDDFVLRAEFTPGLGAPIKVKLFLEQMEVLVDAIAAGDNLTIQSLGITTAPHSDILSPLGDHYNVEDTIWSSGELLIRDIAADLTGIESERISRTSTFFRLGIDSVIAIRFAKQLRAKGLKVSSADIMRFSNIASLSSVLKTREENFSAEQVTTNELFQLALPSEILKLVGEDKISTKYLCTPLQSGMLSQTVASDGRLYVHHHPLMLSPAVNLETLKTSWNNVVARHDILRTSFHYEKTRDARWIAAVHEDFPTKWIEETTDDLQISIENIAARMVFVDTAELGKPPVKVTILQTPTENLMLISLHHCLYDGTSIALIYQELAKTYLCEEIATLTPFSQAAELVTQNQPAATQFWTKQLNGYRCAGILFPYKDVSMVVSSSKLALSTPSILEKCKELNVTLQTVGLLAFSKVLCTEAKCRDIVFGHVVAGRSLPIEDVDAIIGPLFNTVPLRIRFDNPIMSNIDALSQLQRATAAAQLYEHASLSEIQKEWRKSAPPSSEADTLLDALFVFQRFDTSGITDTSQLWTPYESEAAPANAQYGLNFELVQLEDEVQIEASLRGGKAAEGHLESILAQFQMAFQDILETPLRGVTAHPATLSSLPLFIDKRVQANDTSFAGVASSKDLEVLRAALAQVSQVSETKIKLETSIYTLGIDSISAIHVAATCRRSGMNMSVADVLQGRSLGGILRLLELKITKSVGHIEEINTSLSKEERLQVISKITYQDEDVDEVLHCLPGQVYHLASWLKTDRTSCESAWTFTTSERLNNAQLQKAWDKLREQHTVLRTVFATNASAYQVVLKPSAIYTTATYQTEDCTGDLETAVKLRVMTEQRNPSDLFSPPASLAHIQGRDQSAIVLNLHHAIYDAWTITTLLSDLACAYQNEEPCIPANHVPFVQYTTQSLDQGSYKDYWITSLSESQPTIIPSLNTSMGVTDLAPYKPTFSLIRGSITGVAALELKCRNHNLALSTLITIAFARALAHLTHTTSPVFGFFQAGRSSSFEGAETTTAPCVNILPLTTPRVLEFKGLQSALNLQDSLSQRVPYEQSYLADVVKWTSPTSTPLFNASLNLLWHRTHIEGLSSSNPFFKPMLIGVPSDYTSEVPLPGRTAIDGLDTGYLASQNLFVDVGPNGETDSIDFGVKCEAALMSLKMVEEFVARIVNEFEEIMKEM